jgi:hypothetical protein
VEVSEGVLGEKEMIEAAKPEETETNKNIKKTSRMMQVLSSDNIPSPRPLPSPTQTKT